MHMYSMEYRRTMSMHLGLHASVKPPSPHHDQIHRPGHTRAHVVFRNLTPCDWQDPATRGASSEPLLGWIGVHWATALLCRARWCHPLLPLQRHRCHHQRRGYPSQGLRKDARRRRCRRPYPVLVNVPGCCLACCSHLLHPRWLRSACEATKCCQELERHSHQTAAF